LRVDINYIDKDFYEKYDLTELLYEKGKFDIVINLLNCKKKLTEKEIMRSVNNILNKRNNFIINALK
jgi:hypothetical protein